MTAPVVPTPLTHHPSPMPNDNAVTSPLNPDSFSIEPTPGGVRVKLPTLVLGHLLSLAGLGAGQYALTKPDVESAKVEILKMRSELDSLRGYQSAMVERLARIEANTENIWEDIRERRGTTRNRRSETNQQP